MLEEKLAVWRLRQGHVDALRWIYEKYKEDLLGLAVMATGRVDRAEDVVQDVFLKLAQSCDRITIRGNLRNYLITCLMNRIRTLRRKAHRQCEPPFDEAALRFCEVYQPDQWAVLNEQMQRLCEAMGHLPPEQREVVTLRFQAGLGFPQIARIQDAPVNTVQGRFRYGMEKLRSLLNSEVTACNPRTR